MTRYESKPSDIEAVQWTGDNWDAADSFAGEKVRLMMYPDRDPELQLLAGKDGALMVGWFANAMCVAADAGRRKIAEQIMGYPITIDFDRLGGDERVISEGKVVGISFVDEAPWNAAPPTVVTEARAACMYGCDEQTANADCPAHGGRPVG